MVNHTLPDPRSMSPPPFQDDPVVVPLPPPPPGLAAGWNPRTAANETSRGGAAGLRAGGPAAVPGRPGVRAAAPAATRPGRRLEPADGVERDVAGRGRAHPRGRPVREHPGGFRGALARPVGRGGG